MAEFTNNTSPPSLPAEVATYAALREKGMELIRELSGREWTDHNVHDPGITILEQLCYALTDLSYRINFPIPDLMTEAAAAEWPPHFQPGPMLSSAPVSLLDWRKLLIDTPGVRNAWIYTLDTSSDKYDSRVFYDPVEQALRMSPASVNRDSERILDPIRLLGLYRVAFIPESGPGWDAVNIKNEMRRRLHQRRNLCEDFHLIETLDAQEVQVEARIEAGDVSDPAALLADIYFVIHSYLSPRIRFYTLQERLADGYSIESLLEGPQLEHGFLDDEELEAFQLRRSVRISDLIRLIMGLRGVRAVQSLRLSLPGSNIVASTREGEPWELIIPDGYAANLAIPPSPAEKGEVGIRLFKAGLPMRINWETASQLLLKRKKAENERTKPRPQKMSYPGPRPGRPRQPGVHQSIQHQFPEIYGLGETGLPRPATPRREAQARQLKAYLAIFDQLLANTFAQLEGVGKLFSLKRGASEKTYFSQSMRGETPDLEPIIAWNALGLSQGDGSRKKTVTYDAKIQEWAEGADKEALWERRNRLLNHLLARFGEEVVEYDDVLKKRLFNQKEALLDEYAVLGGQRGKGFNYAEPLSNNADGLKQRLCLLLGFPATARPFLSGLPKDDPGSFHIVEHILLRPGLGDKSGQSPILQLPAGADESRPPLKDPFSLQLSFLFPGWLNRFDDGLNPGFRTSVVKTLREETPAHLKIFVRWLSPSEMAGFEQTFSDWMEHLKTR